MGKLDDQRRMREAAFEARDARAAAAAKAKPAKAAEPEAEPSEVAPSKALAAKASVADAPKAADGTGECSGCGKTKPVVNGLVASHQKGFGKVCSGARQPPAA